MIIINTLFQTLLIFQVCWLLNLCSHQWLGYLLTFHLCHPRLTSCTRPTKTETILPTALFDLTPDIWSIQDHRIYSFVSLTACQYWHIKKWHMKWCNISGFLWGTRLFDSCPDTALLLEASCCQSFDSCPDTVRTRSLLLPIIWQLPRHRTN